MTVSADEVWLKTIKQVNGIAIEPTRQRLWVKKAALAESPALRSCETDYFQRPKLSKKMMIWPIANC